MILFPDRQMVENLICRIFDYYNPRFAVESFNYGILRIDWCGRGPVLGMSCPPNKVIIYPTAVYNYANNSCHDFYDSLTETVIHELFHNSQLIEYESLRKSYDRILCPYRNNIELAVEQRTAMFLIENREELRIKLGIDLKISDGDLYAQMMDATRSLRLSGYAYYKRTPINHILAVLRYMLHEEGYAAYYQSIYDRLYYNQPIYLSINNNVFNMTLNDVTTFASNGAMNDFNNFVNLHCFMYEFYDGYCYYNYQTNTISFNFTSRTRKMCEIVTESEEKETDTNGTATNYSW